MMDKVVKRLMKQAVMQVRGPGGGHAPVGHLVATAVTFDGLSVGRCIREGFREAVLADGLSIEGAWEHVANATEMPMVSCQYGKGGAYFAEFFSSALGSFASFGFGHDGASEVFWNWRSSNPRMWETLAGLGDELLAEPPSRRLYAVVKDEDGLRVTPVGSANSTASAPLERGNYASEVLSGYDRMADDLRSSVPRGRIAIIDGLPGTGKTWMIRGLIDECPGLCFVNMPASMVQQLEGPDFMSMLLSHSSRSPSIVLVIEDGDECIVARGPGNRSSLRALLNLSDGLLGVELDLRCIVTTNSGHLVARPDRRSELGVRGREEALDAAVLRDGRRSERVTVRALGNVHVSEILERLGVEDTGWDGRAEATTVLSEVYAAARKRGWEPPPRKVPVKLSRRRTPLGMI